MESVGQKSIEPMQSINANLLDIMNKNLDLEVYIDKHAWELLKGYLYKKGFVVELSKKPKHLYIYVSLEKGKISIELKDKDNMIYKELMTIEDFVKTFS
ncbi:MAG: hypothetical protein C0171_00690 [Caldisphaera sp.]|jgi:hypothetical protein|uniref:hypothetical protein n=1 Tax=Caldisphaera sp. TaxID=2060322 RepID=UPI000CC8BE7C|nr:hypothetical protein [Caldisphaera sp.]PMP59971.1 MAG: hypothetical protein C0201_03675 [Caldisphaera sp.]PMP92323.1 MAG: hypothetical protein C0171_00690 [Caldisphaera sp.]